MKKFLLLLVFMVPMLAFTGCGGDDEPMLPEQTIKVGQTYTIPYDGEWTSDNVYIANVKNKIVTGKLAGTAAISNGSKSFNIIVEPTLYFFTEPCLDFGASRQVVRNYMIDFQYVGEVNNTLTYIDKKEKVKYGYSFEDDGLKMAMAVVPGALVTATQLGEFLAERYIPVTYADDYIAMISPDRKMIVIIIIKIQSGSIQYGISYSLASDENDARSSVYNQLFEKTVNLIPGELVNSAFIGK